MATPKNQSVQKAFALLRSFRGAEEWVTNAELSRRTGLSEACAHRLMKTTFSDVSLGSLSNSGLLKDFL